MNSRGSSSSSLHNETRDNSLQKNANTNISKIESSNTKNRSTKPNGDDIQSAYIFDIDTALNRGASYGDTDINQVFEEISKHQVKQVLLNPRQLLDKFHDHSLKLFDRIFGEDTTSGFGTTFPLNYVRGAPGGWLRKLNFSNDRGNRAEHKPRQVGKNESTPNEKIFSDKPYMQLLHPLSAFIELLIASKYATRYFNIKVSLLPRKLQMFLKLDESSEKLYSYVSAESQAQIFNLLHVSLKEQYAVINAKANDQTIHLEPIEYFFICMMRYPLAGGSIFSPTSFTKKPSDEKLPRLISVDQWIQPFPYLKLLREYLKLLLPIGIISEYNPEPLSPLSGFKELFLYLIAEFWLAPILLVRQGHKHIQTHRSQAFPFNNAEEQLSSTMMYNLLNGIQQHNNPHPSPVEVQVLDNTNMFPTIPSMQCVYLVLTHIFHDSTLSQQFNLCSIRATEFYQRISTVSNKDVDYFHHLGGSGVTTTTSKPAVASGHSFLPKQLEILQQPLFDMFRFVFGRNDINPAEDRLLQITIEIWLLYLCPWKAAIIVSSGYDKAFGIKNPDKSDRASSHGKYISSEWKSYIAANIYFYTTLLAMVMKHISHIDLLISTPEDVGKLKQLDRIINAFTGDAELLQDIRDLSSSFRQWYPNNLTQTTSGISSTGKFGVVNSASVRRLDGANGASLSELYAMKSQHVLLFPDRSIDRLDDFGIVTLNEYVREHGKVLITSLSHSIFMIEQKYCYLYYSDVTHGGKEKKTKGTISSMMKGMNVFISNLFITPIFSKESSDNILFKCRFIIQQLGSMFDVEVNDAMSPSTSGYLEHHRSLSHSLGLKVTSSSLISSASNIRNHITCKLTETGKSKILNGEIQVNPLELRWNAMDVLDKPLTSFEIPSLTRMLVRVSKDLNSLFSLPLDKDRDLWTWDYFFQELNSDWSNVFDTIRLTFRLNFRCFGSLWNICIGIIIYGLFCWIIGDISLNSYFVMLFISFIGMYIMS